MLEVKLMQTKVELKLLVHITTINYKFKQNLQTQHNQNFKINKPYYHNLEKI